jgi:hypothetical protein
MKHGERMLICTLAGLALCTPGNAVTGDATGNPYQGIVDRNVFGLKPPPPPPDPESNKPPPPKIFLTGITTILGNKRALLKTTPPAKPGEPAKEQSFTLGEGQREGDIEVLEINEKAGTVKVNDYGTITTLDFDKDGVKATAAVAPGPGGAPAHPPGFAPTPGANPFVPARGANTLPRPMRLPAPGGASAVSPAAGGAAPASTSSALNSMPFTPEYGSPAVTSPGYAAGTTQTQPALSGEAQAAMLAAQQLANKGKVYPPAPPPIAQLLGEQNNSGSATTPRPPVPQPPRAPSLPPLLPQ